MKNNKYITGVLLALILILSGCEDFLSTVPDSTRTNIKTPDQMSKLLTTAYPRASYIGFSEAMSDNVGDKGVGTDDITNRQSFLFNEITASADEEDTPEMYWSECYRAISVANEALKICSEVENPSLFSAQKGEALLARAYAHFMLVSFFCKFYDPATDNSSPGIPYVTEPEDIVIKKYERKTVAYVYEMIEKDLLAGLQLVRDAGYSVPKYHFNVAAANAFASRFYLVKKQYDKVLTHCAAAFPGGDLGSNLRPWNTTYAGLSYDGIYKIYSRATESANLLLTEARSLHGRYVATYRYGLTYSKYQEVFASSAIASGSADWVYPIYYQGDNNYFVPKLEEYFVRESVNAEIGFPYIMIPLFTAEEVLFNRAEANVYLGNTTAALSDLNLFASKRIRQYNASNHTITTAKIRSYYGTNNVQTGLLNTILDFKRTEFLQEGMRWFDMMRYKITVTHTTREGSTIEVPSTDPRRVLQLPQSVKVSGINLNER